jgi:hypothetical protein
MSEIANLRTLGVDSWRKRAEGQTGNDAEVVFNGHMSSPLDA